MTKLTDIETENILKKFKIPVPERYLAKNEEHAVLYAHKTGFPVVMKISSPHILHKTDAGCVVLDIRTEDQVRHAYDTILVNAKKHNPTAHIDGIIVQKMITGKNIRELIIGSKKDPQFGPVIMFGLGGIFVEVLKDVTFRLVPVTRKDVREMIREIKAYKILEGVRGQEPVNFRLLEDIILNVSKMIEKTKNISELDINPLLIDDKRAIAIDTRIII